MTETISKLDEAERPPRLLDEREAGRYLGVSPRTLRTWREKNVGPDFHIFSKVTIRYDINDLDSFIAEHPRRKEGAARVR